MDDSPITPGKPAQPNAAKKLIGGLVIVATLLGGVAAAFQIRDSMSKTRPDVQSGDASPASVDGSKEVAGPQGAKLRLPKGWSVVSRQILEATYPNLKGILIDNQTDVVFFQGPNVPEEDSGLFGYMYSQETPGPADMEDAVTAMRGRPDTLMAEIEDSPAGKMAHLLNELRSTGPDGTTIAAKAETFMWVRQGRAWSLMLTTPDAVHLQHTQSFGDMARSVTLP